MMRFVVALVLLIGCRVEVPLDHVGERPGSSDANAADALADAIRSDADGTHDGAWQGMAADATEGGQGVATDAGSPSDAPADAEVMDVGDADTLGDGTPMPTS